jgi:hypothetical protein
VCDCKRLNEFSEATCLHFNCLTVVCFYSHRAQLDPNAQAPNYPINNGDKLDF